MSLPGAINLGSRGVSGGVLDLAKDNLSHSLIKILFRLLEIQEINIPHMFILGDTSFLSSPEYTLLQEDNTQIVELEW